MEPLNCNYKLTKDRVERAIAEMTEKREVAVKMLEKDGMQGMLLFGWKKDLALIDTLLAALDAVRWRDVSDKPENDQCVFLNCGYDCCWGFYDKRSDFVINPHNGDVNRLDAADRWYPIPLPFPKR